MPTCCWSVDVFGEKKMCGRDASHKLEFGRNVIHLCTGHHAAGDSADLPPIPRTGTCIVCSTGPIRDHFDEGICSNCLSSSSPLRVSLREGYSLRAMCHLFLGDQSIATGISDPVFEHFKNLLYDFVSNNSLPGDPEIPHGFQIGFPANADENFTIIKIGEEDRPRYTIGLDNAGNLEIKRD